jgi:hypothetical protein
MRGIVPVWERCCKMKIREDLFLVFAAENRERIAFER